MHTPLLYALRDGPRDLLLLPPPPGGWGMGCATHPWERVAQGSLPGYNMDAQVCSVFVVALGGGYSRGIQCSETPGNPPGLKSK